MSPNAFSDALSESLAPREIDTFTPLGYTPHLRQKIFHDLSRKRVNSLLLGGAAGGGKSMALLMEAIYNAVNYPNMRVACIRRTYPELDESFLAELSRRNYAMALGGKWNNTSKTLRFPNGSLINFTYAETEVDASRFMGGEYQLLCFDEASLFPERVIQQIEERLRSGNRELPVIGARFSTNPGGISHLYLKKRFIKATDYGKFVAEDEQGRTTAFVQSLYTDNPYLDAGYEAILNSIEDPQRRSAMRDGDWESVSGMFFESWSRFRHVVPPFDEDDPYRLPVEWQRFAGIDYGFRAPFGTIWAACDNDERLWIYDEIYAKGVNTSDQALMILAHEEKHTGATEFIRAADPSMWGHRGTPLTIADDYGLAGCGIIPADNDRINGWSRVHHYLNDGPACEYHRSLDPPWETCPLLHVFDGNCPMFVETTPSLQRSKTKPEDADTTGDDHLQDCLRYLAMVVNNTAQPVFTDGAPKRSTPQAAVLQEDRSKLIAGKFAGNLSLPGA